MTHTDQEATLKNTEGLCVRLLRHNAATKREEAQRALLAGHEGFAAALIELAMQDEQHAQEIAEAYKFKYTESA